MATDGHSGDAAWCHNRARELRAKGFTWAQVVDVLALDRKASPLRLHRLAHNRSGTDVVDEINQRDPANTAALRVQRLYDYEMWPDGGRRPSVWTLPVLARIYQTSARRLITDAVYASYGPADQGNLDAADFSHLDANHPRRAAAPPAEPARQGGEDESARRPWLGPGQAAESDEVTRLASSTSEDSVALFRAVVQLETEPQRQETLFRLALGMGGVSGLPLVHKLSPEERDRLAGVTLDPRRADASTVQIFKKLTEMCRHLDDARGPETVIRAMLHYRALVAEMLRDAARTSLWQSLVRVYAELSQFTGWLLYDVGHYAAANRHFQEGLAAAQEVRDIGTVTYIHCCLTHMACFRGEIPTALDHAFAARGWASQSGSPLLASYTEQMAAWAYSLEGWEVPTAKAMLRAQKLLPDTLGEADPPYLYFVDRGFTVGFGVGCWLRLDRTKRALVESADAIALTDPLLARNRGFRLLDRAGALIAQREFPEAATVALEIADLAARHSSARLSRWLRNLRDQMQPWAALPEVQLLDEHIAAQHQAAW
ncbi:hypothetical protein [Kutzneria albida]|uniref:Uncharacterized protein n=1 Tax=Kutzneria albida DSM 43870 TaxID=1449976 RepID=W5W9Y8_9PSEU|nr:hypothetical protein [Kutzneria albida]AHH97351.1 hypothetical protein KALB_3987 [Kutzneria albida DSM 43870]